MSLKTDKPISVVCLVLQDQTRAVLATQRAAGKRLELLWEFPGGKVESDETPELALRREIKEELGIEIGLLKPLPRVQHCYDFGMIELLPFCSTCEQHPELTLSEHVDAKWIALDEWHSLQWAPADIPVIQNLLEMEKSK